MGGILLLIRQRCPLAIANQIQHAPCYARAPEQLEGLNIKRLGYPLTPIRRFDSSLTLDRRNASPADVGHNRQIVFGGCVCYSWPSFRLT